MQNDLIIIKNNIIKLCACGCGQEINEHHTWIHGHSFKGKKHSEESKEKMSDYRKGRKLAEAHKKKISNSLKGEKCFWYGKKIPEDIKEKIRQSKKGKIGPWRGKKLSDKTRKRISEARIGKYKGEKNHFFGKKHSEKTKRIIGEKCKLRWQNKDYANNLVKNWSESVNLKPNKSEFLLYEVINKLYPNEYKYVGDGQIIIQGKCPDFININGQKKIIELFGAYWHKKKEEKKRINIFKELGYETLIIWDKELKDESKLKNKLIEFHKR